MDNHELFELTLALINIGLAALGYVLWQNLRDVREDAKSACADSAADAKKANDALAAHELYCARTYVTQDGLTKSISDLKETITGLVTEIKQSNEEARQNFRDVFSKLNGKQDKP
jgi:F0F1-type ATP synthase membrane subunit b/b'